jgi:predicted ATPase
VGREQELAQLQRLLFDPHTRLVTVIGPGGAGKTRVAREVAARLVNHFLEGVCYVDLTRLENAAQLPGALATALQIVLPEQAIPRDYLLGFLREREILLLLDNFEHLLEARQLLHDILQQAPAVRFLITSRRTVDLHEEQLYELAGLDAPSATAEPDTWRQYDAMRLLLDLTARYRGPVQPTNDLEAAAAICRLVQGSPLAIELAAATSRTLPLSHIARAIAQDLDILQTSLVNVPQRHRSVRAAIDHSWKLLDRAQQNAFASVALFRGGFSLAAAEAVAEVGASDLQALVTHSLLRPVTTEDGSARWEMHELLRQYGRERLKTHPERLTTARDRHAAYYLALLQEQGKQLRGEEALAARATIARDSSNIRAAWRHACNEQQWQRLSQSLDYLVRFYQHDGRMRECLPLLEEALQHAEADAQAASVALALRLRAIHARLLALTGQPEQALIGARKALEQAEATENAEVAVEARYVLALVHFNKGQHVQSRSLAEEALAQAQQAQLATLEALLLNMIGRTFLRTDAQQAGDYFNLSLQRAQALAIRRLEISSEINLSLVEGAAGNFAQAAGRLRQAQTLADRYGQHELQGTIALNLGSMLLQLGQHQEGLRQYDVALAAYRRSGDRARVGLGYHCQAVVAAEAGDIRDAQRNMRLAWELYRETGAQHRQLEVELWLGTTSQALGQYRQGRDWLLNALRLAQETHAETQQLEVHRRLIWLATEVGDYELAHSHLEQSIPLAHDRQALEQRFWLLLASSRLAHYEDHLSQAEVEAREALEMVRERSTRLMPEATIRLAHTLAQCEAWEEAQRWYQETEKLRSERQQPHLVQEAQAGWARAALALGDTAAARQVLSQLLSDAGIVERFPVQGQQEPFLVCLFCYELLHHAQDERARSVLANTLDQLHKRAQGLDHPWRDSFLEGVPVHRELIKIAGKQGVPPPAA